MNSTSSLVRTPPVGFCGVLTISSRVLPVTSEASSSRSIRKPRSSRSRIGTGFASMKRTSDS